VTDIEPLHSFVKQGSGLAFYRHHLPHFHFRYQGHKASIAIEDGRVLAGSLPPKQLKLIEAWVELHRDELCADWELAVNGEEPFRIAPLQ